MQNERHEIMINFVFVKVIFVKINMQHKLMEFSRNFMLVKNTYMVDSN